MGSLSEFNRLDLEVLRLAAELQLDKTNKSYGAEHDKQLWEFYRMQNEHIELLASLYSMLKSVRVSEHLNTFECELSQVRTELKRSRQNIDVMHHLIANVKGIHLPCKPEMQLKEANAFEIELATLRAAVENFKSDIASGHEIVKNLSSSTITTSSNLMDNAVKKIIH